MGNDSNPEGKKKSAKASVDCHQLRSGCRGRSGQKAARGSCSSGLLGLDVRLDAYEGSSQSESSL